MPSRSKAFGLIVVAICGNQVIKLLCTVFRNQLAVDINRTLFNKQGVARNADTSLYIIIAPVNRTVNNVKPVPYLISGSLQIVFDAGLGFGLP